VEIGVILMLVALVATLGSAAAAHVWVADLAVHFRLQWAAFALAGCLILAAAGDARWAALAFVVATIQALLSAPLLHVRAPPPADPAAAAPLRLMAINVWCRNRQYQRVIDCIARERPDVILLAEVTAKWEQALAPLDASYAHCYATRGAGRMGLVLLSRWPMQAVILPGFSDVEPAIAAHLIIKDRRVQLLSVHTNWPLGPAASALRARQLALIAEFARSRTDPLIVVGDLNVSPFSPHFQALLAAGNLKSAAQGFGWQPTWPTFLPPAGIQIDHALTSPGVIVTSFRRGAHVGSDHLPTVIDCLF